ncbi:molybdopterin molybdotransferase MoeA [Candidatus Omnitrophota bacterium]
MMMEYSQALNLILKNTKSLPIEKVAVEDSVGRILRENIYSKIDMPPFNKSAMDGYALRVKEINKFPAKLKRIGIIEAGEPFRKVIRNNECVKIMTGASLPKDADAVVKIEDTMTCGKYVEVSRPVKKWENVCMRAEDIGKNDKVLAGPRIISTSDIALLAAIGRRYVKVARSPEVAVLNTGGEIIPTGQKISGKKIYNSNGPQLMALLKSDSATPCFLGIAKDRPQELRKAIRKGLDSDMLLISGGVSVGDFDLVPSILKSLGVKKIFHNVRCKPGKPLLFAKGKKALVFGIPGNPVSNFLAYHIFIYPALLKMAGYGECAPCFEEGLLDVEFHQRPGRKHFVPVQISKRGYRSCLKPITSHGSADILALSKADGFMVVEADTLTLKSKSKVQFIRWKYRK